MFRQLILCTLLSFSSYVPITQAPTFPLGAAIEPYCATTADPVRICDCYVELANGRVYRAVATAYDEVILRSRDGVGILDQFESPGAPITSVAGPGDEGPYGVLRERMEEQGGI